MRLENQEAESGEQVGHPGPWALCQEIWASSHRAWEGMGLSGLRSRLSSLVVMERSDQTGMGGGGGRGPGRRVTCVREAEA